jgi:hypothetical protein
MVSAPEIADIARQALKTGIEDITVFRKHGKP